MSLSSKRNTGPNRVSKPNCGLRVCIVSTEFIGPTRGGGIATFFSTLAERLAEAGYDVTLLYVLGRRCDSRDIDHWVRSYAERNIRLVPMASSSIPSPQPPYVTRSYDVYRWLAERRFDIVHFADAQGTGYYTLAAKHQGRRFEDTVLNVSTQGGTIYLREACARYIERVEDLELDFMERESVGLADTVVSPSRFMLEWMKGRDWKLPERCYVRQNLLPSAAQVSRNPREPGRAVRVEEVVFFGKASELKGLVLFCDALELLKDHTNAEIEVTFLGRAEDVRGVPAPEYLERRFQAWPFRWQLISDRDQRGAVEYLMRDNVLAVIPSRMDNSPSTVLECLGGGVPLLASAVGGIPELVAPEDRPRVLFELRPEELMKKLRYALEHGAHSSKPALAFEDNERGWLDWHERVVSDHPSGSLRRVDDVQQKLRPTVSICISVSGSPSEALPALSSSSAQRYESFDVIVVDDASPRSSTETEIDAEAEESWERVRRLLSDKVSFVRHDVPRGVHAARNTAAKHAAGEYLLFLESSHEARSDALSSLVSVVERTGAEMVTSVVDCVSAEASLEEGIDPEPTSRWLVLGGADAAGAFRNPFGLGVVLFEKAAYRCLVEDAADDAGANQTWELLARAVRRGLRLEVVPEPLFRARIGEDSPVDAPSSYSTHIRSLRPYQESVPVALRDVLSLAAGQFHRMERLEKTIDWQRVKTKELEERIEELEPLVESNVRKPGELASLIDAGRLLARMKEYDLAEGVLNLALQVAESVDSAAGLISGAITLCKSFAAAGRHDAAMDAARRAVEIASRCGDAVAIARARAHLAAEHAAMAAGARESQHVLDAAIRMAAEAGEHAVSYCFPVIAEAFGSTGRVDLAQALYQELLEHAERCSDRGAAAKALLGLGTLSRAGGRESEGSTHLLAAVKAARESEDSPLLLEILGEAGEELARTGQAELARSCFTALHRLASDTQNAYTLLRVRRALATLEDPKASVVMGV